MLAIKLRRIGRKHQPAYRLVVAEKKSKLGGKYVEDLGWYNPKEKTREFKNDRIEYWLKTGAQPTDTVHNLLVNAGIMDKPKIAVHKKSKKKEEEKPEGGTVAETQEAPKAEEVKEGPPLKADPPLPAQAGPAEKQEVSEPQSEESAEQK